MQWCKVARARKYNSSKIKTDTKMRIDWPVEIEMVWNLVRISVRYTVGESDAARPDTSCSPIQGTRRNIETRLFPVPRGRHSYESVNFLIRRAWWPCLLPRIKRYQPINSITSNQHRLVPSTFPCLTDRLRVKGIAHKNNTKKPFRCWRGRA
jgi:hypothetical protein